LLEVAFVWRRRLAPNSSLSNARLNPVEPNLRLSMSSLLKVSPPQVGVEKKLLLLSLCFVKKTSRDITAQPVAVVAR
jgi:hypothetical protein